MPVDSLVCDEYHFEHHGITVTQLGTFNQFDEAFWGLLFLSFLQTTVFVATLRWQYAEYLEHF